MISLMSQNHLESGLKAGVPEGVEVAYKGGWLYKVYDDVGFVWNEDHPYVVAIFSKYGNDDPKAGKVLLEEISAGIWKAQDGSKSEGSSNSRDSTRASD
jgi:beta-lactamase class A